MEERIGLEGVRELMRRYLDEDGDKRTIVAEGATIEEALKSAAIQLDCTVNRLEYEVLEKGITGFVGLGKKNWKITAYEVSGKKKVGKEEEKVDEEFSFAKEEKVVILDVDGEAFVRLAPEGVMLKVTKPVGKGKKATEKSVVDKLHARACHDFDENIVKNSVKVADGQWVRVGNFISNPAADALMVVDISVNEMEAYVMLTPPQPGGSDLSRDIILAYLRNNNVVFGVDNEVVQNLENEPKYKERILIAQGKKAVNGDDASINFMFETDRSKLNIVEKDGKVDYKELHLSQNVVEGQTLAKKIKAKMGVAGRTVTGKTLPAKNGKDIPLPMGKNVHSSDDGLAIMADVNGEATYINNKISVETVFTINGDVDLKTGNQFFLGTIIVTGNVQDGFSVKATGNVEVRGTVGRAEISAEGDIIVNQGIAGKGSGVVTAGKSVYAKFIENAQVSSGDNVVVTQSIVNSKITADKRIICNGGRHAAIIGGEYRACNEINAKTIGSPSGGAETILEVGSDPKSKIKMEELDKKQREILRQMEEFDKNINTLNETKRQRKTLPEDKQEILDDLIAKRTEMKSEVDALKAEYDSIANYLANLKIQGKVSVAGRIYPGAKISIRDISYDIKQEYKGLTFFLENMMIKTTKYEEVDEEILKRGTSDASKTN